MQGAKFHTHDKKNGENKKKAQDFIREGSTESSKSLTKAQKSFDGELRQIAV